MNNDKIVSEAFAAWAATYDDDVSAEVKRFAGVSHQEAIERLLDLAALEPGYTVLDVGTGTGAVALRVALQDGNGPLAAVDVTPAMLAQAIANARLLGVRGLWWAGGSAERLPYGDSMFDVVVTSLALHHARVPLCLTEICRVLKPGGRVAILDMGAPPAWREPPISWLMQVLRGAYRLVGGVQGKAEASAFLQTYTEREWAQLLAQSGMVSITVEQVMRPGQRIFPCVILAAAEKVQV